MKLWPELRALAFLRRIAVAMESVAASQRNISQLATAEWERSHPLRKPTKVELSTMDIEKIEKEWREEQQLLEENRE